MNKAFIALGFGLTALGLSAGFVAHAHGAKAHVHGNAAMQVVIDGKNIEIELQSPMASLVGFEHAPRTENQKRAVKALEEQFAAPATLFEPNAEAKCKAEPARLSLPFGSDSNTGKQGKDVHSELDATIRFQCEHPEQLKGMEVQLFGVFNHIQRLDVQMMTPRGQSASRLTPKQTKLQW